MGGIPPHPRQQTSWMAICPRMLQNKLWEEMALGVFLALHYMSFSICKYVQDNNNPFYYCASLAKMMGMSLRL